VTLDNYITASTTRVKGDKNVPKDKFEKLKEEADKKLRSNSLRSRANLNGVNIEFQGNSKHQYDFWTLNCDRSGRLRTLRVLLPRDPGILVLQHRILWTVQELGTRNGCRHLGTNPEYPLHTRRLR